MDLLLFNKIHWYDLTTQKRRDELATICPGKFDSRYELGDIIETQSDRYYRVHGFNKTKGLAVVEMPGIKDIEYLSKPQISGEVVVKKSRYNVDLGQVSFDVNGRTEKASITDTHITDKQEVVVIA